MNEQIDYIKENFRQMLGLTSLDLIDVTYDANEVWHVRFDGRHFEMSVGSDDDIYHFVDTKSGSVVEFDIQ